MPVYCSRRCSPLGVGRAPGQPGGGCGRRACIKWSIFLSFGASDRKDRKSSFRPRLNQEFAFAACTSFFSFSRMRTAYNVEIFIWLDGLPGGTCRAGLRQQPVLRLFCCFWSFCRLPVSIFEALWPKRYYFMHDYPFFDISLPPEMKKNSTSTKMQRSRPP